MHVVKPIASLFFAATLAAPAMADPRNDYNPAGAMLSGPHTVAPMPRNFLQNPNFDLAASADWVVNHHDHPGDGVEGGGGLSAARNWSSWVFAPGPGDVSTRIERSTLTGRSMIHVKLNGTGSGLVQTALPQNTGPEKAYLCAWVQVVRGRVGIGAGNGGNTSVTGESRLIGKWERIEARNGVSPANEFIIYGQPGSEFYVENAVFSDVWPPNGCDPR